MAKTTAHPKRRKICVFCHYWYGNADMRFVNTAVGFEFNNSADGKCMKTNCSKKTHTYCQHYQPSIEASKLL